MWSTFKIFFLSHIFQEKILWSTFKIFFNHIYFRRKYCDQHSRFFFNHIYFRRKCCDQHSRFLFFIFLKSQLFQEKILWSPLIIFFYRIYFKRKYSISSTHPRKTYSHHPQPMFLQPIHCLPSLVCVYFVFC